MKVILDIKDNKAAFVMELLSSLSFVKARPLSDENAVLVDELKKQLKTLNWYARVNLKPVLQEI